MIKNNLIQLLNTFSKKEMTRFYEFAHSPYHNKHREVQLLIGYLHKIYPQFTEKKCDRVKVFKTLFPKQKHDQANLALLFTYAFRLAKAFLIIEQFQTQENELALNLLRAFRQREQGVFYEKKLAKAKASLASNIYKGSPFYWQQYALAKESDLYYEPRSRKTLHTSISQQQDFLDYFYLSEKLKDACELRVRSQILQIQFEVQFIENIIGVLNDHWERYANIPPIAIYYHLYRMITEKDTAQYYQALQVIEQNSKYFPHQELKDIYTYLQNYCIKKINESDTVFMEELLKIYKIQLERGLLQDEKKQLSEWHYKNIVTLGLRLKEQAWVATFIEQYKTVLPKESQANAYRYNRAVYAYEVGDYDKVLELLLKVEYTNIQYNLGARWLLLRTYFELEEVTAFLALCDSFRLYLQRNQLIASNKKKGHEQGIRLAKKVFQFRLDAPYQKKEKSVKELAKLKTEIAETETVFNRSWLMEKLSES